MREAPAWLFSGIIHMLVIIVLGLLLIAQQTKPEFMLSLSTLDDGGEDFQTGDDDVPFDLDEPPLEAGDALEPSQLAAVDDIGRLCRVAAPAPMAPLGMTVDPRTRRRFAMALTGRERGDESSRCCERTAARRRPNGPSPRRSAGSRATSSPRGTVEPVGALRRRRRPGQSRRGDGDGAAGVSGGGVHAGRRPQGAVRPRRDPRLDGACSSGRTTTATSFSEGSSHGRLYTQALCTIALCELYGMTGDSRYREPAQNGAQLLPRACSRRKAGWRYQPGFDSDTSVTGWFVMALAERADGGARRADRVARSRRQVSRHGVASTAAPSTPTRRDRASG